MDGFSREFRNLSGLVSAGRAAPCPAAGSLLVPLLIAGVNVNLSHAFGCKVLCVYWRPVWIPLQHPLPFSVLAFRLVPKAGFNQHPEVLVLQEDILWREMAQHQWRGTKASPHAMCQLHYIRRTLFSGCSAEGDIQETSLCFLLGLCCLAGDKTWHWTQPHAYIQDGTASPDQQNVTPEPLGLL